MCDPEWRMWKTYLGTTMEVFDAELYTIGNTLEIALNGGWRRHEASRQQSDTLWIKIYIWTDSPTVIK